MAIKEKVKTPKTFIVQRTYEFIVEGVDRDEAIREASLLVPAEDCLVGIKCGTPKQMKRDDVQ